MIPSFFGKPDFVVIWITRFYVAFDFETISWARDVLVFVTDHGYCCCPAPWLKFPLAGEQLDGKLWGAVLQHVTSWYANQCINHNFFEMLSFKGYTGWFVVFSRFSYFASTRSKEFIYQRLFISFYKVITQVHTDWYEIHDLSKNRQIVAEENLRNTSCQAGRCFRILIIG